MDKVYVCYNEEYNGVLDDEWSTTIGIASTEEKAIELINEYANLHYANREENPCNHCENIEPDCCKNCNKEHRGEDEWRKAEGDWTDGWLQCYDGEYGSYTKHYYMSFELDKLHEIGS